MKYRKRLDKEAKQEKDRKRMHKAVCGYLAEHPEALLKAFGKDKI